MSERKRMRSQVTTKRGDKGETTALSGDTYSKGDPLLDCVGTLDELRAHTALARLMIIERRARDHEVTADFLFWLLHAYFLIGSACSDPLNKHPEYRRGEISQKHLDYLEAFQFRLEAVTQLPPAFIVSASDPVAAQVDVTCTVARRLERSIVRIKETLPDWQATDILRFMNRLSDTLYMLARYLEDEQHLPLDYSVLDR